MTAEINILNKMGLNEKKISKNRRMFQILKNFAKDNLRLDKTIDDNSSFFFLLAFFWLLF